MTDSKVMVLCCCAAGNVYPLSRATDYKPPHDREYYDSRRRAAHSKFFAGQVPRGLQRQRAVTDRSPALGEQPSHGQGYLIQRKSDHSSDVMYVVARPWTASDLFHPATCSAAGQGAALKPGFDAHWFCVTQPQRDSTADVECYVPEDDRFPPCYDEIVVKEEKQVHAC